MDNTFIAKKHGYFWAPSVFFSILLCFTVIIPIFILLWTFLRWKLDKLEIRDGCLYSRTGVIFIDKKTIPLEQISFISVKTDIISEMQGFGCIQIQSSAFAKAVEFPCIKKPDELIKFVNDWKKSHD